jgi:hypothetical protein
MQSLILKESDNSPKVVLAPEKNCFEFTGSSHPENPAKFYNPILEWIDEYAKTPNELTEVSFKLDYFNSSTAKYLLNIFWGFEKIMKSFPEKKVVFIWYYKEEDLDAYASGERYAQLTTAEFRLLTF